MPLILLIIYLISFWYVRRSLVNEGIDGDYLLGLLITVIPFLNTLFMIIFFVKRHNLIKRFFNQ